MYEKVIGIWPEIQTALGETFYMLSVTIFLGIIFGGIVGTALYLTREGSFLAII
ncbi:hypothetical protein [Acinetobacter sp. LoGeW2-3]|uniref:hypothetical protein n=1 Tax=Acinetobacter sp. LoGeW2-3 TaxID=1808001 RepID=UPI0026AD4BA5|nr:hypothetical protein [Acinetobacter sp. LoGeW2-3]